MSGLPPFPTRPPSRAKSAYFSRESGTTTRNTYKLLGLVATVFAIDSFLAPWLVPKCHLAPDTKTEHLNPDYVSNPCRHLKYGVLLGMSPWDADMNVRILMSLGCGSVIGFERRRADRAAGIRTMALVCLGACVFTIASAYAFIDGPMAWDASRVSAAIPSGVGFLGAASIWKGTRQKKSEEGSDELPAPEVHGLTTATSVWLSSAVGILTGGALYIPALFTIAVAVVYLRFAPRLPGRDEVADGSDDSGGSYTPVPPTDLMQPLMGAAGADAEAGALRTPITSPQRAASCGPDGVCAGAQSAPRIGRQHTPGGSVRVCGSEGVLQL